MHVPTIRPDVTLDELTFDQLFRQTGQPVIIPFASLIDFQTRALTIVEMARLFKAHPVRLPVVIADGVQYISSASTPTAAGGGSSAHATIDMHEAATCLQNGSFQVRRQTRTVPRNLRLGWADFAGRVPPLQLQLPPLLPDKVEGGGRLRVSPHLWFGTPSVHTEFHHDCCDNLITQISGRKTFTLASPGEWRLLVEPDSPTTTPIWSSIAHPDRRDRRSLVHDTWGRAWHEDELLTSVQLHEVSLPPGHILYLPAGWFHHVANQEPTVMVNWWLGRGRRSGRRIGVAPGPAERGSHLVSNETRMAEAVASRRLSTTSTTSTHHSHEQSAPRPQTPTHELHGHSSAHADPTLPPLDRNPRCESGMRSLEVMKPSMSQLLAAAALSALWIVVLARTVRGGTASSTQGTPVAVPDASAVPLFSDAAHRGMMLPSRLTLLESREMASARLAGSLLAAFAVTLVVRDDYMPMALWAPEHFACPRFKFRPMGVNALHGAALRLASVGGTGSAPTVASLEHVRLATLSAWVLGCFLLLLRPTERARGGSSIRHILLRAATSAAVWAACIGYLCLSAVVFACGITEFDFPDGTRHMHSSHTQSVQPSLILGIGLASSTSPALSPSSMIGLLSHRDTVYVSRHVSSLSGSWGGTARVGLSPDVHFARTRVLLRQRRVLKAHPRRAPAVVGWHLPRARAARPPRSVLPPVCRRSTGDGALLLRVAGHDGRGQEYPHIPLARCVVL